MAEIIPSEISKPQSIRILMIEDSENDVLLMIRELKKGGYSPEYERVETSVTMKKALQEKQWDIILCDYNMPAFNAPSAIAVLQEANIDIPLIIVTGAIGEEAAAECMRLGAHDYIMKTNLSRLCRAVTRVFEEADSRKKRKQAEEALRNERNLIVNIMESSPVGITTADSNGRIKFANSRAVEILGLSKDEILQTTYNAPTWDICDLDGKPLPDDQLPFAMVMSTGKSVFNVQHAIQWPDGKRIWLSINGVPMIDANGHVTGMVASIEDITQRKLDDAERKRLMAAIEQVAEVIVMTDAQGSIQFVNPAFERTTGYTREEAIGQNARILKSGKQDGLFYRNLWETISNGKTWTGRIVNKHKDETYYTEEVTISPVYDVSGQIVNYVAVKRDITEHLLLTNQLFQSQKMEAIGTLAGGIAHDFNNILASIIGYTELALDGKQKEKYQQFLQQTLKGAERAKNLVKQILTFSRQESSEKKPLDIKLLLKEAVKFLRASIPATIEIEQKVTDESCNIMADPTQMHQVIMNLCTNATHAMKKTGGILKIELTTIELAAAEIPRHPNLQPGSYVQMTVSDTGHGIDPVNIQRIFDPFFTTKTKDEGTGLGLSVVYGIVKGHNGIINVYSEPAKGAVFNVYLPRIILTEAGKLAADKPVTGGTERILFVDDEPSLVELGTHILSSLGYEVTGVTSSVEALEVFRAKPQCFDLVITDMTLPKMTGIILSREILKIRPDIPIILCSGIRESDTENQVKSLGIRAYLTKPLSRRELARLVRKTLDGEEKAKG